MESEIKETENCTRKYLWSKWEESGFQERVNHAVTSCVDEQGHGYMYSMGGFEGRGRVWNSGHEIWNDLGQVPMDVVKLDVGMCQIYTIRYL